MANVGTGGGERTENSVPFGFIPTRLENSISCANDEGCREEDDERAPASRGRGDRTGCASRESVCEDDGRSVCGRGEPESGEEGNGVSELLRPG